MVKLLIMTESILNIVWFPSIRLFKAKGAGKNRYQDEVTLKSGEGYIYSSDHWSDELNEDVAEKTKAYKDYLAASRNISQGDIDKAFAGLKEQALPSNMWDWFTRSSKQLVKGHDATTIKLKADGSFANDSSQNNDRWVPTSTQESSYGGYSMIMYLHNFNNSSDYSFVTYEEAHIQGGTTYLRGLQGGGTHTVNEANDGINFSMGSGNIDSGTFTLYKVI